MPQIYNDLTSIPPFFALKKRMSIRPNCILEKFSAPCRFAENFALTLITDKIELESVNKAMTTLYEQTVNMHIKKAITALFSNNTKDCCNDAYGALEALAKTKTGETKNGFDKIIYKLEIDSGLKAAIKSGWGICI